MSNNDIKDQPVQEIRLGLIKAVVRANPAKSNGVMHNVKSLSLYRTANGDWHETQSLARNDLPLTAQVPDAAHPYGCRNEPGSSLYCVGA